MKRKTTVKTWQKLKTYLDDITFRLADLDEYLLHKISNTARLDSFSRILILATYFGDGYLWGILAFSLILFGGPADQEYVLIGLALSIINITMFRLVKTLVERPRPTFILKKELNINRFKFRMIDSFAFPSGHATMAFGLSYAISQFYPNFWAPICAYLASFIIGLSRIYVKEHYPSDVLGGALLGTFVAIIFTPLLQTLVF